MLRIEFIALCGLFVFMVTPPVEGKGCEDLTIRVSGIPEKLSFPIPEGTNYILTATIKGGKVRSVWLANRHDAKGRVMLKRVDEAEYQINLAEPAVFGLMRTYSSRSFKVFAETEEGKIHESISLQYSILRASPASMKVFILSRSEKEEVRRTYPWNRRFLTPKSIDGVMIEYGRESPSPFACAYVGKKKWTLEYGVSKNALHLNLTSEIRSCWSAKGLLTLQYGADKEHSKEIELYAIPLKLDLPGNVGKVTVHQRSKVSLPGCNDYLKVKLGDITAGFDRFAIGKSNEIRFPGKGRSTRNLFDEILDGMDIRSPEFIFITQVLGGFRCSIFLFVADEDEIRRRNELDQPIDSFDLGRWGF